jgi:hypothetical protein
MFEPFPKLARLSRECVITEKLDGTNAQVIITPYSYEAEHAIPDPVVRARVGDFALYAGSRTRLIYPGKTSDNFGFAQWVLENADELVKLGIGRHFGEWYGQGIQRGYGLDHKRFALFDTRITEPPACCEVVPVLYQGEFDTFAVEEALSTLAEEGSHAAPGFMNPEGVVVYHTAARVAFKKTFDDKHKEAA